MLDAAIGECVASRDFIVDEVDLFLFSAACWLPHRIHFDQEFARSEGLQTVAVHGPLQAAWLVQLASQWAAEQGARLVSSVVRHVEPAYPREVLHATLAVTGIDDDGGQAVTIGLRRAKADGTLTTVGSARIVADEGARA